MSNDDWENGDLGRDERYARRSDVPFAQVQQAVGVKRWVATRFEPDGAYNETVYALDAETAKEKCRLKGWQFEGELMLEIPLTPLGWWRKIAAWLRRSITTEERP